MITLKLNIRCVLCGQKEHFYIMPRKEKVSVNDFINSPSRLEIMCKKCGERYDMQLKVTRAGK